jgi:competence protein ComEC
MPQAMRHATASVSDPRQKLRLIFPALLAWVLGTAAQLQQVELASNLVYGSIVAAALCLIAYSATKSVAKIAAIQLAKTALALLSIGLLAFALTGLRAGAFLAETLSADLEGADMVVTGVVAAMPQRNEAGLRFRFDVESAQFANTRSKDEVGDVADATSKLKASGPVRLPPSIYLGWYNGVFGPSNAASTADLQRQPTDLTAGERWQMTVRLKAPHGGSNPHGFDYELWLWEQGLQATGYVRAGAKDAAPQRLAQTWAHPVEALRQRVRDAIFERVRDRKLAGVIAALVVGDQNAIERADWDIFRATGVAHLMSISGLHVTMFAWGAALLVGWGWRRSQWLCLAFPAPSAALVGGVLLAAAYATFSGGGVPAQRTILMLATVGLLRLSGRRWPWPQIWMLACAVVVLWDPWALMQAGFWLSFVAVGVLFATDSGAARAYQTGIVAQNEGQFPDGPPLGKLAPLGGSVARAAASVGATFREQWVITVALTPLTLLLFGQVSVVGLAANALAIPWVTLIVTPLAMLGTFFAPIWDVAAWAVQGLAVYLNLLMKLPFASVSIAQAPLWAGAAGMAGGILLAMRLPWSVRLLGLPLMLPVMFWLAPRPALGHFEMLAADIGQGNAVIVQTASHALVYDTGPRFSRESDAGHRMLVPLLRALDVRVDTVVLSHRDIDHTGGALAVLTMQPQAALLSSIEDQHELQGVRKATRCVAGQHWHWDGVDFDILQPYSADYEVANKTNAMSCVLRISNGKHVALLTGDIEKPQEARLVDNAKSSLKSDVLLVPHHGSKTSSSAAFLDAVQPHIALVQAGYRNRFGHPADEVMDRYDERKIEVFDSPHCGATTWTSSAPSEVKCQRLKALRYWHHRVP